MVERSALHGALGPLVRPVRTRYRRLTRQASVFLTLLRRELTTDARVDLPWRRRLWLYRRGFTSESGQVFGVDEGNYRDLVSDLQHERADGINEPWDATVNNKLTYRLLFGSFSAHLPDLYGLVDGGALIRNSPLMTVPSWEAQCTVRGDRSGEVVRFAAAEWIDAHLEAADALVLKPVYGYGGHGVLVCRKPTDTQGYDVNGESTSAAEFATLLEGLEDYLAWAFVEQGPHVASIYPGAVNTVRVLTMWDEERDEPFVAGAAQRIGTDLSAPVDNISSGGLTAEVSEAGELSRAAQWIQSRNEVRRHEHHPDTGVRIEGVRVPDWPDIRERLLEIAATIPYFRRLGWDVVVTGDGAFVVLEVNAHADTLSVQLHRPLLRDPRVRRFYDHHGYL